VPVRQGRVTEILSFSLTKVEIPDDEVLAAFLAQYYGDVVDPGQIPDELVLTSLPDGAVGIGEWLSERRGRKVAIVVPQRGQRADLMRLANENAAPSFREKRRASDDLETRLEEIQTRLRLPTPPHRIECC